MRGGVLTAAALITSAVAGILVACTVFDGEHARGDGLGASEDDAAAIHAGQPDPCAHRAPAAQTHADDDPHAEIGTLVFALRSYGFDPTRGYDLDGTCTCDAGVASAHDGGASCGGPVVCDPDGGVDNALGGLGMMYTSVIADVFNGLIQAGRRTALLEVHQYNGLANDDAVTVSLVDGAGIRQTGCPSSVFDAKHQVYSAGWCGLDVWSVDSRSVLSGGVPKILVGGAYVVNHQLVAHIGVPVPLPGSSSNERLTIAGGIVTATLEPFTDDAADASIDAHVDAHADASAYADGDAGARSFRITDGLIVGRVSTQALFGWAGIQTVLGTSLCLIPEDFSSLKRMACGMADLNAKGTFDPSAECTSYSAAISFTAAPAIKGSVHVEPKNDGPCDPGADGNPVDASARYSCP